jgi:phospholipase/carboxylesterase
MQKILILLHGYGASGDDMESIKNAIQKYFDEDLIILTPNAPFKTVDASGFEWFPIVEVREDHFLEGLRMVHPFLEKYIENQIQEFNVSYSDIILAGFSQGACLAIHSALRLSKKISCVISFAGGIIDYQDTLRKEIVSRPNICMIHGKDDRIVPCKYSIAANQILIQNNVSTQANFIDNLDHAIESRAIKIAADFIKKNL